jgi:hypothetical protein
MKYAGYLFAVICGLIAIQIIVVGWSNITNINPIESKDYITYVQMIVTFITAVLLAVFNFSSVHSTEKYKSELARAANAELARLQSDLSIETANSVEKIRAEFTLSVNDATERLRLELNKNAEDFRARLGQSIPQKYNGYHSMFKAATKYFFAIRRLEEGIYPEKDLKDASAAADDAIGSALIVEDEDRHRFFGFITEANYHAEVARQAGDDNAIKSHWHKEGKRFGGLYNELQASLAEKVRT